MNDHVSAQTVLDEADILIQARMKDNGVPGGEISTLSREILGPLRRQVIRMQVRERKKALSEAGRSAASVVLITGAVALVTYGVYCVRRHF